MQRILNYVTFWEISARGFLENPSNSCNFNGDRTHEQRFRYFITEVSEKVFTTQRNTKKCALLLNFLKIIKDRNINYFVLS